MPSCILTLSRWVQQVSGDADPSIARGWLVHQAVPAPAVRAGAAQLVPQVRVGHAALAGPAAGMPTSEAPSVHHDPAECFCQAQLLTDTETGLSSCNCAARVPSLPTTSGAWKLLASPLRLLLNS